MVTPVDSLSFSYQSSLLGKLNVHTNLQGKITQIDLNSNTQFLPIPPDIQMIFDDYFLRRKRISGQCFSLLGTDFQKKIWKHLSTIQFGETKTYGDIAKALNTSARAVGQACRKNPVPVLVPCHCVIANNGLGGYSGKTSGKEMDRKIKLLEFESTC